MQIYIKNLNGQQIQVSELVVGSGEQEITCEFRMKSVDFKNDTPFNICKEFKTSNSLVICKQKSTKKLAKH